ncbi:seed biotin-containing protein SBP65-like [Capsicum galapagoense]
MQQAEQKEKDRDIQRDKQSSRVDQGIRGEGPGDIKFASHGQEQKGPVSKLNTKMQNQVGEEGRGTYSNNGGVHPQLTGNKGRKGPSPGKTSQLGETAQQKSNETLRVAENRYEKAKESGASALHDAKESASHGLGAAGCYATAKGAQAKDTVGHGVRNGSQYVADKAGAAKVTALQAGAQAKDAVVHGILIGSEYVVDKAGVAKDTTLEKGYVGQKGVEAKDATIGTGKNAVGYVGQKGVEDKDATLEVGKSAVGYAGEAARTAKDMAEVGALGDAHYTAKGAAAATKASAGAVSSAAGYAGDKVVAAKDAVAGAGKSALGYARDKLAAAKDYVVSAEEGRADYAGKKKAEAERQLQGNPKIEKADAELLAEKSKELKKEMRASKCSNSREAEVVGCYKQLVKLYVKNSCPTGGVLQAIGGTIC